MNREGTQVYIHIHMYPFSLQTPAHPCCHITLGRVPRWTTRVSKSYNETTSTEDTKNLPSAFVQDTESSVALWFRKHNNCKHKEPCLRLPDALGTAEPAVAALRHTALMLRRGQSGEVVTRAPLSLAHHNPRGSLAPPLPWGLVTPQ